MSEWGFCDITVGLCEVVVGHSEVTVGSVTSQWKGLRGVTMEGGGAQ